MNFFSWENELSRDGHRMELSGLSIVMHCHHYNINLLKTIEDTLGAAGVELMVRSVEEASRAMFQSLLNQFGQIRTDKSKLEMAATMYQNCGLGIVHLLAVGPKGGRIVSPSSHQVTGWLAKHGRRHTPGCHFARGWIAGALEAIYERPLGHFAVTESRCKMMRDSDCVFDVRER